MKTHCILQTRTGFTLIELLVAMVVSLVVLFATLQLFENSQRSYVVQENVAEMQQNVRIGKLFLERDLRMAGAGIPDFSFGGNESYPFEFENNVNGTGGLAATIPNIVTGTDLVVVRYNNFDPSPCGTDGVNLSCDDLPQLTLAGDMPPSSTEADVTQDLVAGVGWDANCYCDGTTYTQPTPGMPFIVTAPDGSRAAVLFQTSTTPNGASNDKIGNGPNFTYQGVSYDNKLLNTFPTGSTINFYHPDGLYEAIYYIQDNDGIPCLMRNSGNGGQVIAEYIEDLQLSFQLDTNDDGMVDTTISSADLIDTQKDQVRLVTLNLLGRSANEHRNYSGQRPAMQDHGAGTADGYRRRQVAVTIKVRNLGL